MDGGHHGHHHAYHHGDHHGDHHDNKSRDSGSSEGEEDEDDEDFRESGAGILEFSPQKAGLDVTPANFNFEREPRPEKRHSGALSSIAGDFTVGLSRII